MLRDCIFVEVTNTINNFCSTLYILKKKKKGKLQLLKLARIKFLSAGNHDQYYAFLAFKKGAMLSKFGRKIDLNY